MVMLACPRYAEERLGSFSFESLAATLHAGVDIVAYTHCSTF